MSSHLMEELKLVLIKTVIELHTLQSIRLVPALNDIKTKPNPGSEIYNWTTSSDLSPPSPNLPNSVEPHLSGFIPALEDSTWFGLAAKYMGKHSVIFKLKAPVEMDSMIHQLTLSKTSPILYSYTRLLWMVDVRNTTLKNRSQL